jgi:hypothetical protein
VKTRLLKYEYRLRVQSLLKTQCHVKYLSPTYHSNADHYESICFFKPLDLIPQNIYNKGIVLAEGA